MTCEVLKETIILYFNKPRLTTHTSAITENKLQGIDTPAFSDYAQYS
jgi:hypothetical protein